MKFKRWVLYKVYNIKCFPLFYSKMCIYHDEVFLECKEKTFIKTGLFTRPRQIQSLTYTHQIPTSFKKIANSSSTLYIKPDPTVPKQFRKGQNRNFLILFFLSFHFIFPFPLSTRFFCFLSTRSSRPFLFLSFQFKIR